MGAITVDLQNLYQRYFGTKPKVGELPPNPTPVPFNIPPVKKNTGITELPVIDVENQHKGKYQTSRHGRLLQQDYLGVEVWLPTKLTTALGTVWELPYSVIRISNSKTIIRTALAERKGTVKEEFNTDDYKITIKGFLIDKEERLFPEEDLLKLKGFFETNSRIFLDNALSNIFLEEQGMPQDEQYAVVVTSFDLPEVEGGRKHVRPFVLQLESDYVFTLEVEDGI